MVVFKLHVARHLRANIRMRMWLMKTRTDSNWALQKVYTLQIENINELLTRCCVPSKYTGRINRIGFNLRKSNKTINAHAVAPSPLSHRKHSMPNEFWNVMKGSNN